ncbi:glycosyltransferase [Paraclostridium sordellii]|uniref:glycosyltransferase n=1 Tax=Paraclostridium sordellii TaxID=1505 RepID=UPI00096A402B|nr:glycosyltransferase [Paeniclostridium sordellii]
MNVLFLGSLSLKRNRLDGVTVKSRCLKNWLESQKNINLITIDTDNWMKNCIYISWRCMLNILKADKIVICSAQRGANIVLKILKIFRCNKDIYYFVAGGRLGKFLIDGIYSKNTYLPIKKIYVESEKIVKELEYCGINNSMKMMNFREFNFPNNTKLNDAIKFVFYSRVIKEKGIEDLIYAFNNLSKKYENLILDIYGQVNDNYLEYLNEIMDEGIEYKGVINPDNKIEYEVLSEYDVFVLPTYYEGECLPGALIDAYVSGLAIIASEWEYSREYIEDGEVGYIHKYKDKDDLMKKMEKTILNRDIIIKFKKNSQNAANLFNVNNVLKEFKKELFS